jgi:hypothetical protein
VGAVSRTAPKLRILEARGYERPTPLRLPFRFGEAVVTRTSQAFARVRVECDGERRAEGWAAELMVPKWFDKDPAHDDRRNVDDLRRSVAAALAFYRTGAEPRSAWHWARDARSALAGPSLPNRLLAGFGASLLERAVLDALCRAHDVSFPEALRRNLPGIAWSEAGLAPADAFLAERTLPERMEIRHTVGLADALSAEDVQVALDDGLPESLEEAVAAYGHRLFKIKVSGRHGTARLREIVRVLQRCAPRFAVTLDANESFDDVPAAVEFCEALWGDPALAPLCDRVLYLEQPLRRDRALDADVRPLARFGPVVVDESDDADDAFLRARRCGYAGISSKGCKGLYRALLNRARCEAWNAEGGGAGPYFLAAEDLTTQPGLALQQDLALAGLAGCAHSERNGHHYVRGMAGAGPAETAAFAAAHPDLYALHGDRLRVRIEGGFMSLRSLGGPGFASAALPGAEDDETLVPLEVPA